MKTKIILWISALLLLTAGAGCEKAGNKEKDDSKQCFCENRINTAVNLVGTVLYNKNLKKWCISVSEKNIYDNIVLYIPCDLENSYKKEKEKVVFSGDVFKIVLEEALPAGTTCYCIKITSIEKLQEQYESMIVYENPATDGCGWLVQINGKPYYPVNLADEYKIDKLKVSVDYQLLDSKYTCWPSRLIPEIKIITIKKL